MIQILINGKVPVKEFKTIRDALVYAVNNRDCVNAERLVIEPLKAEPVKADGDGKKSFGGDK
jgi:hypothetical protein